MKMEIINISVTYSEWTPESAEHGEHSDSGYYIDPTKVTFRELYNILKNDFIGEPSAWPLTEHGLPFTWFNTTSWTKCYETCTSREESLHIGKDSVSQTALRRVLKLLGRI